MTELQIACCLQENEIFVLERQLQEAYFRRDLEEQKRIKKRIRLLKKQLKLAEKLNLYDL